ncbi:MAG: lysyl-tRNA synthetase class 2 [Oleiphilaceae bacterium]|jgi:lysyl-tRNA synthetase class 2
MTSWRASCSQSNLKARAALYTLIRAFFVARDVLEVETPLLSVATATDPQLESVQAQVKIHLGLEAQPYYLQTSPEFPMKRLLASGSGAIYQICKTFRNGETGRKHNPEFTMLEWYRPGFELKDLMQELELLTTELLGTTEAERLSYRDAFLYHVGIDPFTITDDELALQAPKLADYCGPEMSRDDYLNLILSICIEPKLGIDRPCFLYEYPPSQASLAQVSLSAHGEPVAQRFELYIQGMELANGYFELTDSDEQTKRFAQDNRERSQLGLPAIPPDERLIAAMKHGLPACSGVAVGLDRILMLKVGASAIEEVLSFSITRA